jgi:hypothetical protein
MRHERQGHEELSTSHGKGGPGHWGQDRQAIKKPLEVLAGYWGPGPGLEPAHPAPAAGPVEPLRHTTSQHNSDNHHKQHRGQRLRLHPAVLVADSFDPVGHNKVVVAVAAVVAVAVAAAAVSIDHYTHHHGADQEALFSVPKRTVRLT